MAIKAPSQGANFLAILSLTADTVLFTYDKTVDTQVTGHPKKGNMSIQINNKIHNEALETHYNTYLHNYSIEAVEETYEESSKDTFYPGSDKAPGFRFVGFNGALSDKREYFYGCGVYSGDTGNFTTAGGALGDYPVSIQTILPQTGCKLTLDAAFLSGLGSPDNLVTTTTDLVLPTDVFGLKGWLPVAT